jgi:hypothetical protein
MTDLPHSGCTAFNGSVRIASGDLTWVALMAKEVLEADDKAPILIFDNMTSQPVEVDFRGTREEVLERIAKSQLEQAAARAKPAVQPARGRGRPKLGVVAREVTLLPRHWEWLADQPGGASITLRKLVEDARRAASAGDRMRAAQEAAYRFMTAIAGNEPGFEEATRALFAGDLTLFRRHTREWPVDVRDHAVGLAAPALAEQAA